jgi:hypothetical protein
MAKCMRMWAMILLAAVSFLGQTALGARDEPGKLLSLDSFEALKTEKGVVTTQPTVHSWGASTIVGAVQGHARLVEGKKGHALEFTGDSRVVYSDFSAINFFGGECSFWVKLNFDPNAKNERTRTVLRNQMFLSFMSENNNSCQLYSGGLNDISFIARDATSNIVFVKGAGVVWNKGEWHLITLRWGNALEVSVDGKQRFSAPWDGLFGPLAVEREKFRMYVGHHSAGAIESEYTIDELTILGPTPGNVACRPRASVPLLEGAPTLDGKLDDPFWQKAGKVTGFVGLSRRELDRVQPTVLIAYTNAGLYLGETVPLPDGRRPQATLTAHNSSVYSEDAFELFLQPLPSSPAFFQLLANAIGTEAEYQYADTGEAVKGYNPEWQVATSSKESEWTAEVFIPFKSLGLSGPPKAGDVWGANIAIDSASGFPSAKSWAFADGNYERPMTFGELLFTGKARALREDSFTGFSEGNPTIRFDVVGDLPPVITARAEFFDSDGKSVRDVSFPMHDGPSAVVGAQFLQAGLYTARLSGVDEAKTEFFRQNVQFRSLNAFSLAVENYPYAGVAELRASGVALQAKAKKVTFQLLSPAGQTLQTQDVTQFQGGAALAKFSNAELEPGDYLIQAAALDTQGKTLDSAKQALKIFPKPAWWKNNLGMDHSVPPPWTPVKATDKGFGVWGRDYQFEAGAFPKQIVNQGKPLFQAAPRLILRAGGKEADLVGAPREPVKQDTQDMVELKSALDVGGVSAKMKGTLEFDGCCRFDLELAPHGADKVDALTLELPLPREIGQFLVTSNGMSGSATEIKGEYNGLFVPYLWLGNDDMGLAFFTESDQYWNPRNAGAVQIIPSADTALLRINIVRSPLALKGPISYSFGLMASPVRPIIDGDPFVWIQYSGHGQETFPENLTYPGKGLTDSAEGTIEFWARRTKPGASDIEIFNILPVEGSKAGVVRCLATASIFVNVNDQRLLTGNVGLGAAEFSHVALVWTPKTVSLYVNGKCAATADATEAFRKAMDGAAQPGGKLRFGDLSDYYSNPAVDVDDVRVSSRARYQGEAAAVPTAPMTKDADTRLLDPLDETFVPDGQDGLTAAGGCPSLGCRFIPGKFGQALRIEIAPARSAADLAKDLNARFGTAWAWQADPTGTGLYGLSSAWPPTMFIGVDPGQKKKVDDYHSWGLKFMPYAAYPAIGGPSPLVEQWGSEWAIKPLSSLPYPPPEGHYMLNSNLSARGFADYLAAGTAWLMDEHHYDGIYTDGAASVTPSQNLYAASGYVDEGGVLRPTTPIFGVREAMKRLYRIVKGREPDGLVCNHMSFNLLLPTLCFSDIHYTGEHEDYENLSVARLRFSSKPWGLQETLLGSSEHMYTSSHTMIALLHGTSILGFGVEDREDMGRKWINLRKAYLAFGHKTAEWVPYFKNRDSYYVDEDPKAKVSLYYHSGKDAFLVVGNMDAQARTIAVQLHLKAFGLEGAALRARNALTQVPVSLAQDGKMNVFVRGKSFVLVAIEPNS